MITHGKKNQVIASFIKILNREHSEEELHQYISKYALLTFHRSEVYSKTRLGSDYIIDFATCRLMNPGPEWVLIEIERGSDSLFTKSGNPSSKLTHSIGQVLQWRQWILENRKYIDRTMHGIWDPKCQVIIGRRHTLSSDSKKLLRQMNNDHSGKVEIVTFDYLIDNLKMWPKSLFELTRDNPKLFSAFPSNIRKNSEEAKRLSLARTMGFDYQ